MTFSPLPYIPKLKVREGSDMPNKSISLPYNLIDVIERPEVTALGQSREHGVALEVRN